MGQGQYFCLHLSLNFLQIESGKPTAEKLLKDAIKLVVKTGVLFHNKQIEQSEIKNWEILRSKINNIANTICYFHRTPFTYNKDMLHGQLDSADTLLKTALKVQLNYALMIGIHIFSLT